MLDVPEAPENYRSARASFLAAARRAGARVTSIPHPQTGLDGEPLALDIAVLGPEDAPAAVLVVSGTHGVEGYAGSYVQTRWLSAQVPDRDRAVRTIFAHALNPFGFSWARRVDEANVDLNRHFIDWEAPRPSNDGYAKIASAVVPTAWDEPAQQRSGQALMEHIAAVGGAQFHRDIAGGQFDHPGGLFYGGAAPGWGHQTLLGLCRDGLADLKRLACLDLHTGLGERGDAQIIASQPLADGGRGRGLDWWGGVLPVMAPDSAEQDVAGAWTTRLQDFLPNVEVTAVALEWGTVDALTVLDALRADAWLHAHGSPRSPQGDAIRKQVRAAFLVEEPTWLAGVYGSFERALEVAHDRVAEATPPTP